MNQFFEADPPRPRERLVQPTWSGPMRGTVPGVAVIEAIIAQNDAVGISVASVSVYPNGLEFEVVVLAEDEWTKLEPFFVRQDDEDGTIPPSLLRLGVEYADGRKAMNTRDRWAGWVDEEDGHPAPGHPIFLTGRGGGGGGGHWTYRFWLWPIPPPGPLQLVCEWPDAGIPLTRHEIDGQSIVDAAARAQEIFPSIDACG
jgi:hypothetical protein